MPPDIDFGRTDLQVAECTQIRSVLREQSRRVYEYCIAAQRIAI